jgi:hypothetical protein
MSLRSRRTLCTTADVARIFGVTMGRVRQMAREGTLWNTHMGTHCLVFDLDEVTAKAKALHAAREAGKVRGPKPKGFQKDPPGNRERRPKPAK